MPSAPKSSSTRDNHYYGSVGDYLKPHIRDGSRLAPTDLVTFDFRQTALAKVTGLKAETRTTPRL